MYQNQEIEYKYTLQSWVFNIFNTQLFLYIFFCPARIVLESQKFYKNHHRDFRHFGILDFWDYFSNVIWAWNFVLSTISTHRNSKNNFIKKLCPIFGFFQRLKITDFLQHTAELKIFWSKPMANNSLQKSFRMTY